MDGLLIQESCACYYWTSPCGRTSRPNVLPELRETTELEFPGIEGLEHRARAFTEGLADEYVLVVAGDFWLGCELTASVLGQVRF